MNIQKHQISNNGLTLTFSDGTEGVISLDDFNSHLFNLAEEWRDVACVIQDRMGKKSDWPYVQAFLKRYGPKYRLQFINSWFAFSEVQLGMVA